VPVTARLSRKFYETFGEDVTNELVDWSNAVDRAYRADLRELNELNFARFDAKAEQRVLELRAQFERRWAEVDARLAVIGARVEQGFASQAARIEANVDARIERLKAELIKWMFLFWIGSVGLALAINALG
jgi:phage shock protein A